MASIKGDIHDEILLLQIFPSEIWLKVFHSLDASEQEKLYYTSPFWRNLLSAHRTKFWFPKILPFALKYLPNDSTPGKVLLHCRAVCRFWRKGVDNFLQDEVLHSNIESGNGRASELLQIPEYIKFFRVPLNENTIHSRAFMNHFQATHFLTGKSPFISNHADVNLVSLRVRRCVLILPEFQQLLNDFGRHISYCDLTVTIFGRTNEYTNARKLLESLPNVKVLNVKIQFLLTNTPRVLSARPATDMQPYVKLPKLKSLFFSSDSPFAEQTESTWAALVANNRHVQTMVRSEQYFHNDMLYAEPMPNLEQFKISYQNIKIFHQWDNPQVTWPLKKLIVNLAGIEEVVKWEEIGRCFEIMNRKFAGTLQELQLYFPDVCNPKRGFTLELPNLTHLTIDLPLCIPLDFILPMKDNLKILNVSVECIPDKAKIRIQEEKIKFFTAAENLYHSNIWTLFPKLEQVTYSKRFEVSKKTTYRRSVLK